MTPTVSIAINNYNYGRFLRKAIDSALSQTYPALEVIVVDDGSSDNSQEIIASYGDRIVPVLKDNGGQASAFNAAWAKSQGEIVCFLDADDFFQAEKVAEVVNMFNTDSDIGWCFHPLKLVDTNTGKSLGVSRETGSRRCDFRRSARRGKIYFYAPATTGLSFRSSLLQKILPMREAETRLCADNYLSCAALALSSGYYLDRVLAIQGIHGSNGFNFNQNIDSLKAQSRLVTASALRTRFPELARYSNREFASALSGLWKSGEIKPPYGQVMRKYWSSVSLPEKLEIAFWTAYRSIPRQKAARHRTT